MVSVKEVPPDLLIKRISEMLREKVEPPPWARWVKTGPQAEKAPDDPDWWYTRLASLLRKLYVMGPIGVSRLAAEYGGKRDRGSARYHAAKGSRAIVRKGLQQLEGLGLVKRTPEGRVLTPEGRSLLDREAKKILEELAKERPELQKYL